MAAPAEAALIFVYGTLKRGYTNYDRYLSIALRHQKAFSRGAGQTMEKYPLVIRHAAIFPATRGPVLMDKPGTGHRIAGELYAVDDSTLEAMDILEQVKAGAYYQKIIDVERDSVTVQATAYFFPEKPELLALEPFACYGDEHHDLYRPGPVNPEIVRLCQPAQPHGLATAEPCACRMHCLRLLPGEDLLASLQRFAKEKQLEAAVVTACVGSTAQTTLRPAGVPTPMVFNGKFEIVSLTGTLSASGHHLHMSISDERCEVRGGHVLLGCIVRTTAEITLAILEGVSFTRPQDARTGYDELCITQPAAKRVRASDS